VSVGTSTMQAMGTIVLTPAQERTLEQLLGASRPRPVFGQDLSDRLRDRIVSGLRGMSFPEGFWMGKARVTNHSRCEGLLLADLEGQTTFVHSPKSAAGRIAHRAIEIHAPRQSVVAPVDLVERAAERLPEADRDFADYWETLDELDRSDVLGDSIRMVESFQAAFPPLRGWAPVTEMWVGCDLGPVSVSGRIDLVLGRDDPEVPMRAQRIAVDLKGGQARPQHAEEMRLYALLMTLHRGVPPFRVATFFLDSGQYQPEDVTEETLEHAADRVVAAARAASGLLAGDEPRLSAGGYCGWCPRREGCPAYAVAAAQREGSAAGLG
jgi:hypothetical protein